MSFIAMNRFKVRPGHQETFEEIWKTRESRLSEREGFREFRMLKGAEAEDHVLYASFTLWASKADFEAWTKSEQFRDAHRNAGNSRTREALVAPPQFEGFEAFLEDA
ncbi:MAG: antibiotic biosynthesis monooxygenase [Rhodobacteraceae bacterium]|nr:antibiotic biosynthesis monooxygenase [Paracoccaceae bacterium]MBR9823773.1 antibiotic biosynthesis monooxygenase [Paracoccaceae bacterium]